MTEPDETGRCPRCGAATDAGAAFCERCGARLTADAQPSTDAVYCEQCGARNEPAAAACTRCGRSLAPGEEATTADLPSAWPPADQVSGGRRRAIVAIAAGAVLLLAVIGGVVFAATRGGDGDDTVAFDEPLGTIAEPSETVETDLTDESLPETDAEAELDSHIPADVQSYGCEADSTAPATAAAGAVCELDDQDLVVQYWLFPDSETMSGEYDAQHGGGEQVVEGDCPDDSPSETGWVDADEVSRGLFTCFVTALPEGDDAHVVWTYDDLLILSILSHISVDSETASLMEFWTASAGPE